MPFRINPCLATLVTPTWLIIVASNIKFVLAAHNKTVANSWPCTCSVSVPLLVIFRLLGPRRSHAEQRSIFIGSVIPLSTSPTIGVKEPLWNYHATNGILTTLRFLLNRYQVEREHRYGFVLERNLIRLKKLSFQIQDVASTIRTWYAGGSEPTSAPARFTQQAHR